jgi:enoyl-CoA hydratase
LYRSNDDQLSSKADRVRDKQSSKEKESMPESVLVQPSFDTLLLGRDGPVATITLNRPEVLNALNAQVFDDLERAFHGLVTDSAIRVILLTGAGEKAFAAGADIAEIAKADKQSGQQTALRGQAVMAQIERCGKPVIACVNGFALGGGCELALCCSMRIGSENARMGQPEAKLGLLPGYGGTQRLPRLVGPSAALRLLLTADIIPATEALRIGLLDEVVAPGQLLARGREIALKIAALAPLAVTAAINAVREGADLKLDEALALEAKLFGELCATHDMHEGTAAFLEKRTPRFVGE